MTLNPQDKINIFKTLFAGRTDVFAQHWISWDRKKQSWFPAHTDRTNSVYASLTDNIFEDHLRGNRTIGVYPLLTNNTSWFMAADFDKKNKSCQDIFKSFRRPDNWLARASIFHIWIHFSRFTRLLLKENLRNPPKTTL